MPLWYRVERRGGVSGGSWLQREIGAGGLCLGEGEDGALAMGPGAGRPIATLRPHRVRGSAVAVLVLGQSAVPVLVNGYPPLPVSLLSDRSEVIVGRHVLRYSAYQPPSITEFSATDPEACCATCTRPLEIGDQILRCASCQAPRHEGSLAASGEPPLLCASYAVRCCRCGATPEDWLDTENEPSAARGTAPPLRPNQEGDQNA